MLSFHVSPAGRVAAAGTRADPFRTPEEARDALRAARAASAEARGLAAEIVLHPGLHRLARTLELGPEDGGADGAPVVWRGEGEGVVLSGAVELPPPVRRSDGLWEIPLPAPDARPRQLQRDDRRVAPARYPAEGWINVSAWLPDEAEVLLPANKVPAGPEEEPELVVHMAWAEAILRLSEARRTAPPELDWTSPMRLRFAGPEGALIFRRSFPIRKPGLPCHWQGSPSCLGADGQWARDSARGCLVYRPRVGEIPGAGAAFECPRLETLVRVRGTPERPVRHLRFENLTLADTAWERPSRSGLLNLQAGLYTLPGTELNHQFVARPPAAFAADHAEALEIVGCVFTRTGATALDFHLGVSRSAVRRCTFAELSGGAISVGEASPPDFEMHQPWLPTDARLICDGVVVADNRIARVGLDYPGTCAVFAGFVRGAVIEHNLIEDVPYCGVSLGWGWTKQPSALRDNLVRANRIRGAMRVMLDGGAIYTLSSMLGTRIEENHITDIATAPHGIGARSYAIYLDEGSDGIEVARNFVQGVEHGNHHKFNPSGRITLDGEGAFNAPEVAARAGPRGE